MIETYDLAEIERTFPYVPAMRACIQDPIYHAEGDAWTHTKMVFEALGQFGRADDRAMRLTALYHDVCKPETRIVEYDPEQGRDVVHHPHHAPRGAATAWHDLWIAGESLRTRSDVYWLCKWHQKIFHIWDEQDMLRSTLMFAHLSSWPKLIDFARADIAGRISPNPQHAIDNLDLLEAFLDDLSGRPINEHFWQNDHDRIFYFEKANRSPFYSAQEPSGSRVVVLSGLPGTGKDTHCRTVLEGIPVVSLDAIREQLDIEPTGNQGRVIQAAFEAARVFLREKKSFVWNAQTITRLARSKIIGLCRNYDAHVTIHAFDRPLRVVLKQNRERARQVPESLILSAVWEPPSLLEAHHVEWV